jgi:hypothetical protein
LQHAAIRRWTASQSGTLEIQTRIKHDESKGDGIRCWIVSSRHGVVNSSTVHNREQSLEIGNLEVQAGDTIDFVVDFNANLNSDEFTWKAEIRDTSAAAAATSAEAVVRQWDSSRDFAGKPPIVLDAWEQLAQVLLIANEIMFVD